MIEVLSDAKEAKNCFKPFRMGRRPIRWCLKKLSHGQHVRASDSSGVLKSSAIDYRQSAIKKGLSAGLQILRCWNPKL
tara:strand:- start:301 stop:534 length:234 start_codon:yes stop_codon:yes gene_type:complete